jgi:asparagine synthase (glutamine-hydrolysing)
VCGIVGLFCPDGIAPYRLAFRAASEKAAHRGPDGRGVAGFDARRPGTRWVSLDRATWPDSPDLGSLTLALGHRRLAIIDLSPAGLQPMGNEEGTLWVVFNGEIYNFLELRTELERLGHHFRSQSDTEVILHAYEAWGERCVERFVGMWAFALADLKARRLFCSRDRFGIKPFHYYTDGRRFVFGSEIKQLLHFPFVVRRVNDQAVYEYLAHEAIDWNDTTFFSNIRKLLPGHNLTLNLSDGALMTARYYEPVLRVERDITPTEAAREFRRLLRDSVRLHLRSDVPLGTCLSGGLDSSAIVCAIHRELKGGSRGEGQHTFSCHFEQEEANELEYMRAVIEATGIDAHFVSPTAEDLERDLEQLVWQQEEPFGSTSIFAQWSVFKLVREHGIKVVLDGQGADEQLAGYVSLASYYHLELAAKGHYMRLLWETWRHARLQGIPWFSLIPGRWGEYLQRMRPNPIAAGSGVTDPRSWIHPELTQRCMPSGYLESFSQRPFGETERLNNVLYQLTFVNNLPALLRYEDRNSMAFSVESRVPFLDHRLVEFVFRLPAGLKIRNGYTKRVMREGLAGEIPNKIRWRARKMGFATPEREWQRGPLLPVIRKALADERLWAFVDRDKAEEHLDRLLAQRHLSFTPWRWANLSLWLRQYDLAAS